jgi:hypothetical protein
MIVRSSLLVHAIPALALGQGEATWLWSVSTQDGDAIIDPGETAIITLELLMESGFYDPEMFAFGASIFDTLGGRGADAGHIVSWNVLEHFADATGDLTTTDGVSLFGTTAMQFDIQGPFSADNPVAIFEFEWAPDVLGSYVVEYETFSYLDVDQHHDVVVLIAKEPFEFM